jgi:hypothetical protein
MFGGSRLPIVLLRRHLRAVERPESAGHVPLARARSSVRVPGPDLKQPSAVVEASPSPVRFGDGLLAIE